MPCFKHGAYHELPPVPRLTEVLLGGAPASPTSPMLAYLWKASEGGCEAHTRPIDDADRERLPNDLVFTHKGKLSREIRGFICTYVCRETANRGREILYSFPASGADLEQVVPDQEPVCDG